MARYLILYFLAFFGMLIGAVVASLSWLIPVSLAVLLLGSLILWRLDHRPVRE